MSGWLSGKLGGLFWRNAYKKIPAGVADAIQKAGKTFDEIEGKTPEPPRATITQKEVNITFRKKEDMIRRHSFPKH